MENLGFIQIKQTQLCQKKIALSFKIKTYYLKIISIIFLFCQYLYYLIIYSKRARNNLVFITCMFGKEIIKSNDRIRKYFFVLDKFLPRSKIIFAVSEFTQIEPMLISYKNININIERYGKKTLNDIMEKYGYPRAPHYYYSGLRPSFYQYYLKKHPEIKYAVVSDDDTLFFRDPFKLIVENPNVVYMMEDLFPFSVTSNGNFKWTNAWANLNDSIKKKCKICELMSFKFKCPGMFPGNAEQGLINYLDLSGELKKIGVSIQRHNMLNGTLLSVPNEISVDSFRQIIYSKKLIALHHHNLLDIQKVNTAPLLIQKILKTNF